MPPAVGTQWGAGGFSGSPVPPASGPAHTHTALLCQHGRRTSLIPSRPRVPSDPWPQAEQPDVTPRLAPAIHSSSSRDLAAGAVQDHESGGSRHLGGFENAIPGPHSWRLEFSEFAGGQICIFEVFQVIRHSAMQVTCTLRGQDRASLVMGRQTVS